ncbi:Isochorismatase hydrolase [Cryphonectria parasitica EP155]|uniref:Isochorismatase hydrolase n=1 Tax=Cryphonectria parasitica (strain ATCC 38755 / EP155) TaxID=660469 RepID=A0A9P4Y889_CRYP1|nr:Isochorismatase hydrolase [Cryphonectria parasitica EP155]KAF3768789.1 Isochorismatase hydrolase [Cryphonectria parasitica EP155]
MPRSALFVIDIQHELQGNPKTRVPHHERIHTAGTRILSAARVIIDSYREKSHESPSIIVFVQHDEPAEGGGILVKGSEAWQLVFPPREGVDEEILLAKTTRDTFESNPDLADRLKASDITEIITFGLQSEYCVVSTSKGALDRGFKVTILQGAHSTYDEAPKSATDIERDIEDELRQKGAEVIPWEDAIATWEQRRMISSYPIFSELA